MEKSNIFSRGAPITTVYSTGLLSHIGGAPFFINRDVFHIPVILDMENVETNG